MFENHIIKKGATVKDALYKLNELSHGSMTLFVVNDNNKLLGSVSDGDIRRGLLDGGELTDAVDSLMNTHFKYLSAESYSVRVLKKYRESKIYLLPILNTSLQLLDIIDLSEKRSWLPVDVLIMAGGEGQRLRPLTLDTPKPMLLVGKKPILEHNIDRLIQYGIKQINISVKYLQDKIIGYFRDGSAKNIAISYISEKEPLGTIGALSLVEKFNYDYVLVMNADVLTNIDLEDMFLAIEEANADMVVASSAYEVKVPYGVIETKEQLITGLKEKPVYTYFSNAGIYLIKRTVVDQLTPDKKINATDLMDMLIADRKKIINYPILGYWLDIGGHESLKKAQDDIKHLEL